MDAMARGARRRNGAIWYAVHFILVIEHIKRKKRGPRCIAYENVYLVQARSPAEARRKGERLGHGEVTNDDTLQWNGSPARYVYGGIRKIISCSAHFSRPGDGLVRVLRDGDEASYSMYVVPDSASLRRLIDGGAVNLRYEE
jgi:hypothetical protein